MKFHRILATTALAMAAAAAGATTIVDIDATSATGTSVSLNAGTYLIDWAGIAGGGLYDGWQYNNAASGNFREAFSVAIGGSTLTVDRNDGNALFNNYATAGAALADFRSASGDAAFVWYAGASDYVLAGLVGGPVTYTLASDMTLTFSVPDYWLYDNKGGVSLALTSLSAPAAIPAATVPEPETYGLMLAGLGVVVFLARRRKPSGD